MVKILKVLASANPSGSISRMLADEFVDHMDTFPFRFPRLRTGSWKEPCSGNRSTLSGGDHGPAWIRNEGCKTEGIGTFR